MIFLIHEFWPKRQATEFNGRNSNLKALHRDLPAAHETIFQAALRPGSGPFKGNGNERADIITAEPVGIVKKAARAVIVEITIKKMVRTTNRSGEIDRQPVPVYMIGRLQFKAEVVVNFVLDNDRALPATIVARCGDTLAGKAQQYMAHRFFLLVLHAENPNAGLLPACRR